MSDIIVNFSWLGKLTVLQLTHILFPALCPYRIIFNCILTVNFGEKRIWQFYIALGFLSKFFTPNFWDFFLTHNTLYL